MKDYLYPSSLRKHKETEHNMTKEELKEEVNHENDNEESPPIVIPKKEVKPAGKKIEIKFEESKEPINSNFENLNGYAPTYIGKQYISNKSYMNIKVDRFTLFVYCNIIH